MHRGSIRRPANRSVYVARIWAGGSWCDVGCYPTVLAARAAIAAIEAGLPQGRGRVITPLDVWLAARPHFGTDVQPFLPRYVRQDRRGYYRIRWSRGKWVGSRARYPDPISAVKG